MAEYGLSGPVIEPDENWFSVTLLRASKVTEKVTENQALILALMKKSPSISSLALAAKVGISDRKIKENIKKLKQLNLISRIGPAKGGHWKVNG